MTLKIACTVDDFAPVPGYGLMLFNGPLSILKKLHDEFGCKFTMFSIPLQDGNPQYSWDANEKWVNKIKELDWLEIQQHGLIHKAQKPEHKAAEFLSLSPEESFARIKKGKEIFNSVGINPTVFKYPGWIEAPNSYSLLKQNGFVGLADHFLGNQLIKQNGIVRVPLTFAINRIYHDKYDDVLILHSHMNPADGNKNGWTPELYEYVRNNLKHLKSKYDVEFVTIGELVDEYGRNK